MKIRTYKELITLPTFEERFNYLKLDGCVGETTFGFNRYLNQTFYHSKEWKEACRLVIIRDNGCDLGIYDRPIYDKIYVHHLNPITESDLLERNIDALINPDFLISTSYNTHNAIHFGSSGPSSLLIERTPHDTCPWK